jgi:hypothetical protein
MKSDQVQVLENQNTGDLLLIKETLSLSSHILVECRPNGSPALAAL